MEKIMNAKSRKLAWTAPLAMVFVILAGRTWAGEPTTPPSPGALLKSMAENGKPGPEHQKLQPLIGDWNFIVRMWTDPNQPPAEFTGTVERKWIMGGRFVQETARGEYDGKPFEGMGLWGYNAAEKKYTHVRACSLSGTICSEQSEYASSGAKFECATEGRCPLSGENVKGRDEVVIAGPNRIVMNVFKTVNGKEVKAMEIVSIRKS
jgi:hypothetical protein